MIYTGVDSQSGLAPFLSSSGNSPEVIYYPTVSPTFASTKIPGTWTLNFNCTPALPYEFGVGTDLWLRTVTFTNPITFHTSEATAPNYIFRQGFDIGSYQTSQEIDGELSEANPMTFIFNCQSLGNTEIQLAAGLWYIFRMSTGYLYPWTGMTTHWFGFGDQVDWVQSVLTNHTQPDPAGTVKINFVAD
jgi:hypothetical protein